MEKRKTFIDTVKQVYEKHENALLIFSCILLFIAGYLVSWNFLKKPLNEGQFKQCEQVAYSVYEQKGNVIVEAPEDFYVNMTTTEITVKLTSGLHRGKIVARLQNGELVMTRNMEIGEAIVCSTLVGILFILGTILIVGSIMDVYKKIRR